MIIYGKNINMRNEFGFYGLGFEKSHFDVRKGNDKVIAFHQRFGAKIVDEDELDYFFNFEKNDYEITKEKYRRYLYNDSKF